MTGEAANDHADQHDAEAHHPTGSGHPQRTP